MNTKSDGTRTGVPRTGAPTGQRPVQGRTVPPPLPASGVRTIAVNPGPQQPQGVDAEQSGVMRALVTCGKTLAYSIIPVVLLTAMAAGAIYVRLRHGPISFDFMVAPVERGINAELVNNSVKIDGAELYLTDSGALEFRLRQLTVFDSDGDAVGGAPMAAVNISAAALWNLRIVPARVELIDSEVNLVYTDNDGLALDDVIDDAKKAVDAGAPVPGTERPNSSPGATVTEQPKVIQKQFNIAKMLTDSSRRARKRQGATSYLTEFGLRNATINLTYQGKKSSWTVPEASVDFDHARRRSVISGRANVASSYGPWAVSFVTDESEKTGKLMVTATVRDLIPASLASAAPPLAMMQQIDLPLAGDATLELSTEGTVESAQVAIEAGAGRLLHPDFDEALSLTAALFKLRYDGNTRSWDMQPSPVKWTEGSVVFSGSAKDVAQGDQPAQWQFALDGKNGVLEAPQFGVPPVSMDVWTVNGSFLPRKGLLQISDARFTGGGADVAASLVTQPGKTGQSTQANVALSPMPLNTLKAIWPKAVAHGARSWVGESLTQAAFNGGTVNYHTGDFVEGEVAPGAKRERLSGQLQINDTQLIPLKGMAPIAAPQGVVKFDNNAIEVTAPDAAIILAEDRRVPIKNGRLYAPDVLIPRPVSEITISTQSALAPFLEAVEQLPVRAVREAAPFPKAGEGKVDAQLTIKLPLVSQLDADDVTVEGKARISDGRFGKVGGQFDVQGFTLALDLTSTMLDAKGDLLVNGVPGKIVGQRMFGVAGDQQPPMKVTAKLDEQDRTQLGLDINDIVRGVVPVEITLQKSGRPEPAIKVKADLTNAEIALEPVAWKKPAGKQAFVEAEIVSGKTQKTELQNLKVSGDDIAVEGWVGISADGKVREFYFPSFALNVVSRLELQGTLGNDDIWSIKANGPTFDGRDVFKSLFSVGDGGAAKPKSGKSSKGTNLQVDIGNVIGGNEISMRGFKMKVSTRNDKLSAFEARGTLDGGTPLSALLDQSGGMRRMLVDSPDAGQVMKLIDFYPNLQGGRLRLEINLDGKGAAEKTGILWVDDFKILGDPIVSEVVGSADDGRPAIGGGKKSQVTREVFQFDRMRAPFSVGYGQFVLEESYLKGPLVGANLRGKVDFKTRRVNLGGTYIPLQGLNSALGGIPLLGQIISGAHGEGIFGITFAVQGALADPQVIVNPLSLVAPGIFREVFQMTGDNPSVQVREERAPSKPVKERVRASAPGGEAATGDKAPARKTSPSDIVDGWSSTTETPTKKTN